MKKREVNSYRKVVKFDWERYQVCSHIENFQTVPKGKSAKIRAHALLRFFLIGGLSLNPIAFMNNMANGRLGTDIGGTSECASFSLMKRYEELNGKSKKEEKEMQEDRRETQRELEKKCWKEKNEMEKILGHNPIAFNNMYQGTLLVKPMTAQLTKNQDWFKKQDPYCVLEVGSQKQ